MLLVIGKSLTALAESRGFKVTNDTIKMSLEIDHPYSSSDKSLEINFSNPNKPWIGFSYNTSTEEKHSFAIKERAKCESYLKYIDYQDGSPNELMHHSDDKSYVGKGKPGVKNSYLFYCINCPKEDKEKLDALEDLSEVSRGDRRGRFLRLKKRRANNITDELDLLGNLSIKANYDYNQEEIDDLYYLLMDSLKHTFSLFDAGSPKDRLEKILNRDRMELMDIRRSDPKLYEYIEENHPKIKTMLSSLEYNKFDSPVNEELLSAIQNLETKIHSVKETLNKTSAEIISDNQELARRIDANYGDLRNLNQRLDSIIDGFNLERK